MKLAIVYKKDDYKLSPESYSKNYRDLFDCLCERFEQTTHITNECNSSDIDADVIIFFDPHSSQQIEIEGEHKAIKYEYYNDPHQEEFTGRYTNGLAVHKLGAEQRAKRSIKRKIDYIICPSKRGYDKYLKKYLGDRLVWFPIAPRKPRIKIKPLAERKFGILANGHIWQGNNGFKPYEFRIWAYKRPNVTYIPHCGLNKNVPTRDRYMTMLSLFKAGLALCDVYTVAKYFEIPLSGGLCFMQYLPECTELGFRHNKNCVFVDRTTFDNQIKAFLSSPSDYQYMADSGRELVENNWTAEHFADFIYRHAEERL